MLVFLFLPFLLNATANQPAPQHVYLSLVFGHKYCACRFTLSLTFVIEGFNASQAHVQTASRWAFANIGAPLREDIISVPSYYS